LATARHLRIWIVAVLVVVGVATTGYVLLEGWNASDSLYMAVMTLTTVGFREVRELDTVGRGWTMIVAVAGVGIIFGTVGLVAEGLLAEVASGRREAERMEHAVAELRDHFIICGYGRVGSMVARELVHGGQRVVVVDIRPESLETAEADGHLVVAGDGTSDAVLQQAGVERARGLVACIDSDANNVYVTLSARALNPNLFIVGRASADGAASKVLQAGANRVVSPYSMAGRRIAELALRPRVVEFIDAAMSHGELAFSMEEVEVAVSGALAGRTVGSLRAEGIFTLAIVRGPGAYEPNPDDGRVLGAGETLIVSGSAERLRGLRERA
jgi:voltage-gated potassium channel